MPYYDGVAFGTNTTGGAFSFTPDRLAFVTACRFTRAFQMIIVWFSVIVGDSL